MSDKFLGRPIFDENTRTWRFPDGSGVVPDELGIEMEMELEQNPITLAHSRRL